MRSLLIVFCASLFIYSIAHSESTLATDCEVKNISKSTTRKIDKWLNNSGGKSLVDTRTEIDLALASDELNCRDKATLNNALHVLNIRRGTNPEAEISAHHVLTQTYDFLPPRFGEYQEEAARRLIKNYKQENQFDALIELWQNPAAKETAYNPLRDAYVLAIFAKGNEDSVMEMLRPLAGNDVGPDDWWLVTFASALAERYGDEILAQKFQNKADAIFTTPRPLLVDPNVEGDRVTQMIQLATNPRTAEWKMTSVPKIKYPSSALSRKETGRCDVVFDIAENGRPENVTPYCSSDIFVRSSRAAFKKTKFETNLVDAVSSKDVIYSVWYRSERSALVGGTEFITGRVALMPYLD